MTARNQDRITSAIWLAAGLTISFSAIRLSLGRLHEPGPGFFAFLSGAILAILSAIVFWRAHKGPSEGNETNGPRTSLWQNKHRVRKMIYVLIALVLYTVGMNYIGFSAGTLLFLGFVLRVVDPQPWPSVIIYSILGSAGSWFIFKYWLVVQLPGGFIGY